MATRKNPDGSITVGIFKDEPKPEVKTEKPKKSAKPKENNGEG